MDGVSVGSYAVLADEEGRVLLTRRRGTGEWVFPGATVEEGEAPWEAVVREVREETALKIDIDRLVGVYVKKREGDLVFVFTARHVGGSAKASDEGDLLSFFSPDTLPAGTSEQDRVRIADALAEHEHRLLRVQPSQGDEPPPGTR
jgi:8-oxo-dGTP diphosphatase